MNHIYSRFKKPFLFLTALCLTLFSSVTVFSQCGPIVQDFNTAASGTAGFEGDFTREAQNASTGLLVRRNVIPSSIYTITSPTYQTEASANQISYGFILNGAEQVAQLRVEIVYISRFTGQFTNVLIANIVPVYFGTGSNLTATLCRNVSYTELPGIQPGDKFRLRFELVSNSGNGTNNSTITFDDFRTNGIESLQPLPVTFINFTGKKTAGGVQLDWVVAGETNVSHYDVERSTDGRTYTKAGAVSAKGKGAYTYTDAQPVEGLVYYKVKNVDKDGKGKYTSVVKLNMDKIVGIKAYPMPASRKVTIDHEKLAPKAQITVSTTDGRIVKAIAPEAGTYQTEIDLSNVAPGLYLLRLNNGKGAVQSLKLIKQ